MITGLLAPDAGEALIAGLDIEKDPLKAKAQFAYVPDTPNLYGKLKAIEYLRFMARLYHVPADEADERIRNLLELFELTDKAGLPSLIGSLLYSIVSIVVAVGTYIIANESPSLAVPVLIMGLALLAGGTWFFVHWSSNRVEAAWPLIGTDGLN